MHRWISTTTQKCIEALEEMKREFGLLRRGSAAWEWREMMLWLCSRQSLCFVANAATERERKSSSNDPIWQKFYSLGDVPLLWRLSPSFGCCVGYWFLYNVGSENIYIWCIAWRSEDARRKVFSFQLFQHFELSMKNSRFSNFYFDTTRIAIEASVSSCYTLYVEYPCHSLNECALRF